MNPTSRHRAFTLVELLVVIGIIAVLLGILLPTINKALKSANRTACLANLHEVYTSLQLYAQGFDDQIPIGYDGLDTSGLGVEQSDELVHNGADPPGSPFDTLLGLLNDAGLMPMPQAFYCPSTKQPQYQFNTPQNPWPPVAGSDTRISFACRPMLLWSNSAVPLHLPKLTQMKSLALLADVVSTPALVAERHSSGVNVLYGDGSAHYVMRVAFNADLIKVPNSPFVSTNNPHILDMTTVPNAGIWVDLDRN